MDTTLRYVQQFGRSKKDNLKPSLLSKYQVGQSIEVYPFRIMDFGCFAATADGLSGLLHNSEIPHVLQSNLQELIDKVQSLQARITKYDRRTGEVAFTLGKKDTAAVTVAAAREATSVQTPALQSGADVTDTLPKIETHTENKTDMEPFQFTTSQPVFLEPAAKTAAQEAAFSEFLDKEIVDIQKFLETVIQGTLSPAAKKMLKELLQQTSIFRFTYTMQTAVDEFEPDVGLQLLSAIERNLSSQRK